MQNSKFEKLKILLGRERKVVIMPSEHRMSQDHPSRISAQRRVTGYLPVGETQGLVIRCAQCLTTLADRDPDKTPTQLLEAAWDAECRCGVKGARVGS